MLRKMFLVATLTALAGCSSSQTTNGIMSSWEGAHIDDVVKQWDYPHEERDFQGKKLYVWHHNKSAYVPQTTYTTGSVYGNTMNATSTSYGGYTMQGSCRRVLEVNDAGNVVNWDWEYNNCPFAEMMEHSSWRRSRS